MADRKPAQKDANKSAASAAARNVSTRFTDEERAAMREHAEELKRAAGRGPRADKAAAENDVLAKIAAMSPPDRNLAERVHAIVKAHAPALSPKLWYGMPAYANQEDQVICFFQDAKKFKSRYATLGFSDKAHLDDGSMWPSAYALKELTAADEARIIALVKKATS